MTCNGRMVQIGTLLELSFLDDSSDHQGGLLRDEMPRGWLDNQLKSLNFGMTNRVSEDDQIQMVEIQRDTALPEQAYRLILDHRRISIFSGSGSGVHYALVSLRQLIAVYGSTQPAMIIEDLPDFSVRGVLIDIGRGKIPTMATLYHLVDLLSDLKINQLQLYMEGYSFAYHAYAPFFPEETPMSAREIQELDQYARSRFIELVPCQNCLGHMEAWLSLPRFNHLAEMPEGMALVPGLTPRATTLDPMDPETSSFVQSLFDDLLPNFTSEHVNINLDEPYELGHGKSLQLAQEVGLPRIYMEYLGKVLEMIHRHGKKAYMWGDVLFHYPELFHDLPDDVLVLDWLYEGKSSFEPHARLLHEQGRPFYVCPGTSSWNSIAGRTDNMIANILDAAENGIRYGAAGLIVTDWGDYGHWQTLPVSYAGYAYAAAFSWNLAGNRVVNAADYLDQFVFQDADRVMGQFWQDLGNYYQYEHAILPNMTLTFLTLSPLAKWDTREDFHRKLNLYYQLIQTIAGVFGNYPFDTHSDYDYHGLKDFLSVLAVRLELNQMRCANQELVYREAKYTIQLISHGADLYQFVHEMSILEPDEIKEWLTVLLFDLGQILDAFFSLWPGRNRKGASVNRNAMGFHILLTRYQERIHQLDLGSSEMEGGLDQLIDQGDENRGDQINHLDAGDLQHVQADADDQQ